MSMGSVLTAPCNVWLSFTRVNHRCPGCGPVLPTPPWNPSTRGWRTLCSECTSSMWVCSMVPALSPELACLCCFYCWSLVSSQHWMLHGLPISFWMSGFFFPQGKYCNFYMLACVHVCVCLCVGMGWVKCWCLCMVCTWGWETLKLYIRTYYIYTYIHVLTTVHVLKWWTVPSFHSSFVL